MPSIIKISLLFTIVFLSPKGLLHINDTWATSPALQSALAEKAKAQQAFYQAYDRILMQKGEVSAAEMQELRSKFIIPAQRKYTETQANVFLDSNARLNEEIKARKKETDKTFNFENTSKNKKGKDPDDGEPIAQSSNDSSTPPEPVLNEPSYEPPKDGAKIDGSKIKNTLEY